MTTYQNRSGQSGVRYFELLSDGIIVQFKDGSAYLYDTTSTSSYNIEQMQSRALVGSGLNSFISTTVKKEYASKLK